MWRILGCAWSALWLLAGGDAAFAQGGDLAACRGAAGDVRIAACTRVIDGGRVRGRDLAMAHVRRANELHKHKEHDRALADLDAAIRIDPNLPNAYYGRGLIRAGKRMVDEAMADYGQTIRLDPKHRFAYVQRGLLLAERNEHDRAIADFSEAIRLNPTLAGAYQERGRAHARKNDHERAVSDFTAALRIDRGNWGAFNLRGLSYGEQKDYDRAIADFSEAIRLSPKYAVAYYNRARALGAKGEHDRALADLDQAISLAPNAVQYRLRGYAHEQKGALEKALADYRQAQTLDPRNQRALEGVRRVETALGRAPQPAPQAASPQPTSPPAPQQSAAATPQAPAAPAAPAPRPQAQTGSRVALVIGNGAYRHSTRLPNPANDATDVAAALRRLGFDVVDGRDLDKRGMEDRLREFGRKLDHATLALFFYAGHGLQVGGKNYLVPVDARLERAGDLGLDTVDLGQVLAQMESEQRVNLVFLDACRDNPLARTLARTLGTRSTSVGSGLATVQSAIGTMIAYATQPENVALDGSGRNSPFTEALLKHIGTPGLDIAAVMRRVRSDVVAATRGKQVPWDHSSLMGDVVLAR
jgi:tetratricopeptide (TPR) repeat protein